MSVFGNILLHIASFAAGAWLVAYTVLSAVRTFVLPRSANDTLTHQVFIATRKLFDARMHFARTYRERDSIMAFYTPISLLVLLPTWYFLVVIGYAFMYYGVGANTLFLALRESASSLVTLGFQTPDGLPTLVLAFSEAILGLILVALLIAYLPTMYSAFSRREAAVTLLEVRAGDPPSAVEMIKRYYRIHGMQELGSVWQNWEAWFADIEESHTSLAAITFFRSPLPSHSWITAAGAVLDGAALTISAVDIPHDPHADLCIRSGYLALRHIADFFKIKYDPNPRPTDPIRLSREEFNRAVEDLRKTGVPIKNDLDQAWRDFSGWRVNYEVVLVALARIVMAPPAPWIIDQE